MAKSKMNYARVKQETKAARDRRNDDYVFMSQPVRIRARYGGTCSVCGGHYGQGAWIVKRFGKGNWIHSVCGNDG